MAGVEHIGSTAVPDVASQPIIDILCAVESFSDASTFSARLRPLAYRLDDSREPQHYVFFRDVRGTTNVVQFRLHIVPSPRWRVRSELLFRDALRSDPRLADAYAALKRDLAQRGLESTTYADAKTAFIQGVVETIRQTQGLSPLPIESAGPFPPLAVDRRPEDIPGYRSGPIADP